MRRLSKRFYSTMPCILPKPFAAFVINVVFWHREKAKGHQNTRPGYQFMQWEQSCKLIKSSCCIISGITEIEAFHQQKEQTTKWLMQIAAANNVPGKQCKQKCERQWKASQSCLKCSARSLWKSACQARYSLVPGCATVAQYNALQNFSCVSWRPSSTAT